MVWYEMHQNETRLSVKAKSDRRSQKSIKRRSRKSGVIHFKKKVKFMAFR